MYNKKNKMKNLIIFKWPVNEILINQKVKKKIYLFNLPAFKLELVFSIQDYVEVELGFRCTEHRKRKHAHKCLII